jgi:hypothetical protein
MMVVTVYVIRGTTSGRRYIGITNDLPRRLREHGSKSTKAGQLLGDFELIYRESFCDHTHRGACAPPAHSSPPASTTPADFLAGMFSMPAPPPLPQTIQRCGRSSARPASCSPASSGPEHRPTDPPADWGGPSGPRELLDPEPRLILWPS